MLEPISTEMLDFTRSMFNVVLVDLKVQLRQGVPAETLVTLQGMASLASPLDRADYCEMLAVALVMLAEEQMAHGS